MSKKSVKTDSYNEKFKGEGTAGGALASLYDQMYVTQFYIDDRMAKKIVDVIPEETVYPGFGIAGVKDEKAFKSLWDGMRLNTQIVEPFAWERLYGGTAIVAVVRDRRLLTSPIKEGSQLES